MLLSHCPNCQHDNKPGERFCAACGVPLDLKPCPVCGKVDSIKATVCSGCGAHFPPLGAISTPEGPATVPGEMPPATSPLVAPPANTIRAFPLIVIALAAGGIPLMWLFRNTMPVPKAWQASSPTIQVPADAPPPQPLLIPRPQTQVPAAPAPAAPLAATPVAPTATEPKRIASPPAEEKSAPEPATVPTPAVEKTPAKPEKPARPAPPKRKPAPVAKKPEPAKAPEPAKPEPESATSVAGEPAAAPGKPAATQPSECTEALAAVGLCKPKAAK